jgi:branched-subunit amino acid ABC-type transport system permease component
MDISADLLINAIVAGLLLGGFYAAVTAGVSISFGMLDIVNIAHPAFIILGSYIAYFININFGVDPIVVSIVALPAFYALGALVYQVYYQSFERRGQESLRGLAFFFGLLFITEVSLILVFGVDYRYVEAAYIGPSIHLGLIDLRGQVAARLANMPPCLIGMEACVGAHHLSRKLKAFGHDARLMPAKYVRRSLGAGTKRTFAAMQHFVRYWRVVSTGRRNTRGPAGNKYR